MSKETKAPPKGGAGDTQPKNEAGQRRSAGSKKSDNPILISTLEKIRAAIATAAKAHRKGLRDNLVALADVATSLLNDQEAWLTFVSVNWANNRRPKIGEQKDAFRWVLKYAFGPKKSGMKKASFYFNALGPLVEVGVIGKALKQKMKTDSLKGLQRQHSKGSTLPEASNTDQVPDHKPAVAAATKIQSVTTLEKKKPPASGLRDVYEKPRTKQKPHSGPFSLQLELVMDDKNNLLSAQYPCRVTLKGKIDGIGAEARMILEKVNFKKTK
ncbi:hypothetical protein [Rhizobium tumorigenes]|uniref:Uncharacterized protein n=1 Tax=Rhizobium tumorigenes TaxID=2041385 RepID=A0AAF1K646_9HYPH|nr:hypothetical protein [Rhizobium tumorigenes]WFR95716.1 hypothetical protein PR017_00765 [Rhizobium tumorigenes]